MASGRNHYSYLYWGWCLYWGFLLVAVISATTATKSDKEDHTKTTKTETIQCAESEEGLRIQAIQCLAKGERFFKKYFKRYDSPKFSRCREYKTFGKCINTLVHTCPAVLDVLPKEWNTARELMNCACNHGDEKKKSSECVSSLNCMEEELNMVFSVRCDSAYQNNLKQKTQDHCHFLTEYILCTEGVVRSACGDEVGSLLYLAHKVAAWNTYQCEVSRWDGYRGFQYSSVCPHELSQSMDSCMEKSLTAKVLRFRQDNDLIPDEGKEAVQLACSAYTNYLHCLSPLNQTCPDGVQAALEHKSTLRIYLMKMEYYCDSGNAEILGNIECYQEVLKKDQLNVCGSVWGRIQETLENMTAFKFYCEKSSEETLQLKGELDNLRQCYESVVTQHCNATAGVAMSDLIRRVFTDPLYLRLEYKPDCDLHTMESLSNRQQPHHHRHGHHRHRQKKERQKKEREERDRGGETGEVRTEHNYYTGSAGRTCIHTLSVALLLLISYWSSSVT